MDEKTIEVLRIEIAKLEVGPGQCLLVSGVKQEDCPRATAALQQCLPAGVKIIFAPPDVYFSVITASGYES
jgi:hypothetical protein